MVGPLQSILHKNVQAETKTYDLRQNPEFFLGELLKPFEERSIQKGLLGAATFQDYYPLWFHYENALNVALWKIGASISERDSFTAWVNPQRLVHRQLHEGSNIESPFASPQVLLGGEQSQGLTSEGKCYYQLLSTLLERSLPHLHALSIAQHEAFPELVKRPLLVQ
ncbi:MAG: hypothetical protein KDD60_00790 [Bdellovibrionales bacterium]|nr:hypothetical protein [Bdellovibrionales bacterium]